MSSIDEQIKTLRTFPRRKVHTKEIAAILGISEAALGSQRRRGTGVPAIMLEGCRPYYDRDDVIAWLQKQFPGHTHGTHPAVTLAPASGHAP